MRPFEKFALSKPNEVPAEVRSNYNLPGNPWGDGVFAFHKAKLPKLAIINADAVPCAYCQSPITRFNTEIDHLVPVKTYARYKVYSAGAKPNIDQIMREANSDPVNLVLSCVPCNQSKKSKVQINDLVDAGNKLYAFYKQRKSTSKVHQKFKTAVNVLGVIAGHKNSREISIDIAVRGERSKIYSDFQKEVQKSAIELFHRSRPAFTTDWETLAHEQGFMKFEIVGHPCLYCLGIYGSGFELDHIYPKAHTQAVTVAQSYNNPLNLVVVCASCNSAKGTAYLTRDFLDKRIQKRLERGISGCELFDKSKNLKKSRDDQNRIFGF